MTYLQLTYVHLASILPAFLIGTYLIVSSKGTPKHRLMGKVYMLLMILTALTTLFMPAQIGSTILNHFGFIHLFSLSVFFTVPGAYIAALNGNIRTHKHNMLGLYAGGILIAGSFALMPGRFMYSWLYGTH